MQNIRIALAGNPNCGKTTVFNALTGARQRVGNWPGVTVERIEGTCHLGDQRVEVTDLPGIYSFSAFSIDEVVARRHILEDRPDVVVNIVDATNLERNLYLTTQLLEMRVPVVVALNKMDRARRRGIVIEVEHLSEHLGCPVIPIVASRRKGMDDLRAAMGRMAVLHDISRTRVEYDSEVESALGKLHNAVLPHAGEHHVDTRWLALKLLEQDELADQFIGDDPFLHKLVSREVRHIEKHTGEDIDIVIADGRYGFIHGLSRDVIRRDLQMRRSVSDAIDKVVLNHYLGIPLFLVVMLMVFVITMGVGGPFIAFFDQFCAVVFEDSSAFILQQWHAPYWLTVLLSDGVGAGIRTVATFIPPIFFLFLCLSFLEDSGYMARAAFVMDRFLRTIGLPGKAFIPMLVGFGCNVPAILAARTLENERDRVMTIMINPFMSCGARLPVYTLFAAVFFPQRGGLVIFALYFTGILLAVLSGLVFKHTILKGRASSFVMELPPYHMPTFSGIMFHTWNRLKSFIVRAGRVIILVVVILSFVSSIGLDGRFRQPGSRDSVLSAVSRKITPVFQPMGLTRDNWPATVSLCMGIFSKELIIGALDSLYTHVDVAADAQRYPAWDKGHFRRGLRRAFMTIPNGFRRFYESLQDPLGLKQSAENGSGPGIAREMDVQQKTLSAMSRYFDGMRGAFAYLLFVLIYAPCVATIAAVYRETNWRWALFMVLYLTGLAWTMATLFYQVSTWVVHPFSSSLWIALCLGVLGLFYLGMYLRGRLAAVRMPGGPS